MNRGMLGALTLALLTAGCAETGTSGEFGRVLGEVLGSTTAPDSPSTLSIAEIDAGLREALTVGTNLVANQLGQTNGYYGDPKIRIPLPQTYRTLQTNLAKVGASKPLDDLELRMNRAAESAVPEAQVLILGAIRNMTITDALNILNGGDTAATDYLRSKTEPQLRAAFTPYAREALSKSGAFTAMENVASQYGASGITSSLQADLTAHAVDYGLDGIFLYVAEEETKIRENPLARSTDLLRRVFGNRG
nr:DUF4197 domain-containing protein [uncultured Hyphomonas sp.]